MTLDSYLVYDVSLAYLIIGLSKLVLISFFCLQNFLLSGFLSSHLCLPWNPVSLLITSRLTGCSSSPSSAVKPACISGIQGLALAAGKKTNLALRLCVRGIDI